MGAKRRPVQQALLHIEPRSSEKADSKFAAAACGTLGSCRREALAAPPPPLSPPSCTCLSAMQAGDDADLPAMGSRGGCCRPRRLLLAARHRAASRGAAAAQAAPAQVHAAACVAENEGC